MREVSGGIMSGWDIVGWDTVRVGYCRVGLKYSLIYNDLCVDRSFVCATLKYMSIISIVIILNFKVPYFLN